MIITVIWLCVGPITFLEGAVKALIAIWSSTFCYVDTILSRIHNLNITSPVYICVESGADDDLHVDVTVVISPPDDGPIFWALK